MSRIVISPDNVHKPTTYYSHAVQLEDVVYTAGQAPHVFNGDVWPTHDPEGQVRCTFENLKLVLNASDLKFEDIVRLNVFVRNREVIPHFWHVAKTYLGNNQPAVMISVVRGLAGPDYLLECDAIVARP